jgi:hypothetical protein
MVPPLGSPTHAGDGILPKQPPRQFDIVNGVEVAIVNQCDRSIAEINFHSQPPLNVVSLSWLACISAIGKTVNARLRIFSRPAAFCDVAAGQNRPKTFNVLLLQQSRMRRQFLPDVVLAAKQPNISRRNPEIGGDG